MNRRIRRGDYIYCWLPRWPRESDRNWAILVSQNELLLLLVISRNAMERERERKKWWWGGGSVFISHFVFDRLVKIYTHNTRRIKTISMKKAEPKWPSSKQHKKKQKTKNKIMCVCTFHSTVGVFLSLAIREGVVCAVCVLWQLPFPGFQ